MPSCFSSSGIMCGCCALSFSLYQFLLYFFYSFSLLSCYTFLSVVCAFFPWLWLTSNLSACIICCHTLFLVHIVGVVGRMALLGGGMYSSLWDDSLSLVNSSVVAVMSSANLLSTLLMHTVLLLVKSIMSYVAWQYPLSGVDYSWG